MRDREGYEKFLKDLERSAPHEARTANLVIRKSSRNVMGVRFMQESDLYNEMKAKDFVVTFDEGEVVFEHKVDFKATDTWNLAIEHLCNGRRSGLASTKAQIWISSVKEPQTGIWRAYMSKVKDLREKLFSGNFPDLCEPNLLTKGEYWHQVDSNRTCGDASVAWFFKLGIDLHVEGRDCWSRLEQAENGSMDWLAMTAV